MRCLSSIFGNHSHIFPALVLNRIKASDQKHPYPFIFFEHVFVHLRTALLPQNQVLRQA